MAHTVHAFLPSCMHRMPYLTHGWCVCHACVPQVMLDVAEAYQRQFGGAEVSDEHSLLELCAALADCRAQYGVRTAFAFSASNQQ